MKFITLQNGAYMLNLEQISSIEWKDVKSKAIVKMRNGNQFKLMGEDYSTLKNALTELSQ